MQIRGSFGESSGECGMHPMHTTDERQTMKRRTFPSLTTGTFFEGSERRPDLVTPNLTQGCRACLHTAMIGRTPKGRATLRSIGLTLGSLTAGGLSGGSNTLSCTKGFKLCRSRKHLPRSRRGSSTATPVASPSPANPSPSTAPRWTVAATYAATVPAAPVWTWNAERGAWLRHGNAYVASCRFS